MTLSAVFVLVISALIIHLATKEQRAISKGGRRKRRTWSLFRKKRRNWYWNNPRWAAIRAKRIEENTLHYALEFGWCCCERCQKLITGRQVHCDHVWPRNPWRIFQYCLWNTQILCDDCNISKSNRDGHHWRMWRRLNLDLVAWALRKRQVVKGLRKNG